GGLHRVAERRAVRHPQPQRAHHLRLRLLVLDLRRAMLRTALGPQANTFAELDLDRAAEYRDDAAWLAAREATPDAVFLWLDADLRLAVNAGDGQPLRIGAGLRRGAFADVPASLLGMRGDQAYFLLHDTGDRKSTRPNSSHVSIS